MATIESARPSTHRRLFVLAAVAGLSVAIGIIAWLCYQSSVRAVAAGEQITATGQFRSPNGTAILTLVRSEDGRTVDVQAAKRDGAAASWVIDATQNWFFMFDHNDKLWSYSKKHGPRSWWVTSEFNRTTSIGVLGGWEGVSDSFLQALPDVDRATYAQWREKYGS